MGPIYVEWQHMKMCRATIPYTACVTVKPRFQVLLPSLRIYL